MALKRWDGAAYVDLTTLKRWDGASWVDLTIAKRWDGAVWQDLAGFGGGSGFSATANAATVTGLVSDSEPAPLFATVTSDIVTVTATGGTGPYTYAWTRVSGDSAISANSPTAASTSFTANVPKNGEREGVWRCTVTDSLSATSSVDVSVILIYEVSGGA